jgi:hypothetical protein
MDDLLIKYILEEATPEENDQVQQWLAADAANRAHFKKLQGAWQLAAQPNLQPVTDTSQALHRLKQTLKAREPISHTRGEKRFRPRVWTAAAAVAGIVSVALGAYVWMKPKTTVKEQPPVVQPDTVLQKSGHVDTTTTVPPIPGLQPVPVLNTDSIPAGKLQKKKHSKPVTPVQPVPRKKKAAQQPGQPMDTRPVKRKHALPSQAAKEPPVS